MATRRWVARVKTDSTHPPAGLFTREAATIARTLASKKVSPKGPSTGMRMLTYYLNRVGKNLSPRTPGGTQSSQDTAFQERPNTQTDLDRSLKIGKKAA